MTPITLSIPDASAPALLALESLLSKGVSKCDSKADEVEELARLLGVKQMKVTGAERSALPPATILPAAMLKEVIFCTELLFCTLQIGFVR